jgi:hypothetical protein
VVYRLDEERANDMAELFITVFYCILPQNHAHTSHQTFRERLTDIIDQAQHFAALEQGGSSSAHDDAAASFREGLDGTERESEAQKCEIYRQG